MSLPMLPVVFEEAMHELMEAAEAGARDDLTELGEFLPLLLEDDVEGIKDSLARNGRDSQGLMLLWACLEGANTCAKYLIKNGALNDVERMELGEPLSAYTPITIAALHSDWEIVEALTEAGAEAHAFDKKGFSVLAVAAFKYPHSNLASLLRLEETRRHINTPNSSGYTPLLMGSPSAVPLLVMAGADVNLATPEVGTALHRACVEACLPLIEALVECGADERHKGIDGRTPLMIAVDQGDTDIVDYWLGRPGVDIGAKTEEGDTVVVTACRKGHVEVLKRLVAAGGRVNSETLYEPGPLVAGVFGGHIEVIKYLVEEAGADIDDVTLGKDVPPPFGLTACDFAAASGQWDALLCLVDLGADLSRCSVKLTFDAVRSKDEGLVARLLDADLSIDSRGADGATPLHTASCLHLPMVQLLVRRGADIEARDNKRRTPLMCAAQAGKVDVVTWLVEAGAEDAAGFTASNLANCTHNKEIADYLWSVAAQRQHKALQAAEERAAAAAAALLEEEDRAAAAKEASTKKKKKKGKKKGGAAVQEQGPSSSLQPSENPDDTQAMTAVLSSLDLGQESIATGGNRPEERAGGGMATVAPGSGMQPIDDVAEGLQGLTTKSDEMAATKVRHGTTASTEEQEEEAGLTAVMQADELSCPISFQLMTDPVVAEDGHTYQRQAIEEWIKKCITVGRRVTSPLTGAEMGSTLRPNIFVRSLARKFQRC